MIQESPVFQLSAAKNSLSSRVYTIQSILQISPKSLFGKKSRVGNSLFRTFALSLPLLFFKVRISSGKSDGGDSLFMKEGLVLYERGIRSF